MTSIKKDSMMPNKVLVMPIRHDQVSEVWPQAAPLIRKVQRRLDDNLGMADIYDDLTAGRTMLWLVKIEDTLRAVIVTEIAKHPRRSVFRVLMIGGLGMSDWLDQSIEVIKRAAKACGCSSVEGDGRLGWAKIIKQRGFTETRRTYEIKV